MKKSVCYILCTIMALASVSVPQRASADSRLLADVEQTLVASCNIGMGYAIKPVKKNVESNIITTFTDFTGESAPSSNMGERAGKKWYTSLLQGFTKMIIKVIRFIPSQFDKLVMHLVRM